MRRLLAAFFAALAVTTVLVAVEAAPAQAAACSGTTGVTVVVDFAALGGGVVTGCAVGDPATGLAALTGAGFTVAGTQRWGLAFVCRINGKPTAAQDPCVNTPPATAYWSYWHASTHGAAWAYSSSGAGSYNPAPGSVEGWAYGAGTAPSITAP
ncbi:hypothetical protein [Hamadaea tsunoensis]|uniref:hypothetical protein n=1 Tax=Hamadaea tsunoensis TaxID=53368 RepID=UPI0003FFD6C9|nr:hypothetical protein [Hamadaea tsunoensis]